MLNKALLFKCMSLLLLALLLSGCSLNHSGLQNALIQLSDSYPALWKMSTAFAYLLGITFIFRAVFQLKQYGEMTAMRSSGTAIKGPIILFIAGAALMFFPSTKSAILMTTFGYGQQLALSYDVSGGSIIDELSMQAVFGLIQLVGVISFIRGWVQLSHLSSPSGGQQNSMGKAMTHIVGGIMAVNIQGTANVLQATFGFS